jgi:hypothetical protein
MTQDPASPAAQDGRPTIRIVRAGVEDVFVLYTAKDDQDPTNDVTIDQVIEQLLAATPQSPLVPVQVVGVLPQSRMILLLNPFMQEIRIGISGEFGRGFHS